MELSRQVSNTKLLMRVGRKARESDFINSNTKLHLQLEYIFIWSQLHGTENEVYFSILCRFKSYILELTLNIFPVEMRGGWDAKCGEKWTANHIVPIPN